MGLTQQVPGTYAGPLASLTIMQVAAVVPEPGIGAEFLFQVVAERVEEAAVILTTDLPFSEWTQVIPNARLCKALLDRITDRAQILETGTESYRFRRTAEKQKRGAKASLNSESCGNAGGVLGLTACWQTSRKPASSSRR